MEGSRLMRGQMQTCARDVPLAVLPRKNWREPCRGEAEEADGCLDERGRGSWAQALAGEMVGKRRSAGLVLFLRGEGGRGWRGSSASSLGI